MPGFELKEDESLAVTIRHWFPILTYCPKNGLPDLIYISVVFLDQFAELYAVRQQVREMVRGRTMYMEDIAQMLLDHFGNAQEVTVRLMFDRHVVKLGRYL